MSFAAQHYITREKNGKGLTAAAHLGGLCVFGNSIGLGKKGLGKGKEKKGKRKEFKPHKIQGQALVRFWNVSNSFLAVVVGTTRMESCLTDSLRCVLPLIDAECEVVSTVVRLKFLVSQIRTCSHVLRHFADQEGIEILLCATNVP